MSITVYLNMIWNQMKKKSNGEHVYFSKKINKKLNPS